MASMTPVFTKDAAPRMWTDFPKCILVVYANTNCLDSCRALRMATYLARSPNKVAVVSG